MASSCRQPCSPDEPVFQLHVLGLSHTEPISKGIAEHGFNAIKLIFWRRKKFYAFGLHFFVGLAAVGGLKHSCAECAFLHQPANGFDVLRLDFLHGGAFKRRRRHLHENDLEIGLALGAHREPAETVGHGLVHAYFKPKFVDVEIFGYILIENKDCGMRYALNHASSSVSFRHPGFTIVNKTEDARLLYSCCLCAVSGEVARGNQHDLPGLLKAEDTPDLTLVLGRRHAHYALKF